MSDVEKEPQKAPIVFFSYAWYTDGIHRSWVKALAARLRSMGIDSIFDGWNLQPGDQLGHYMEKGVRGADFVLCVCTPRYKQRFDDRLGGAGYEANLISGEALATGNERKFIGLLREGNPDDARPYWLRGKLFLDFRGESYSDEEYELLCSTLHGMLPTAPPLRSAPGEQTDILAPRSIARQELYSEYRIQGGKVRQEQDGSTPAEQGCQPHSPSED